MLAKALVGVMLILLGACSAKEERYDPEAKANILPTDYRNTIIDTLRNALEDPTNIRDAAIAEPTLKPVGAVSRYVACIRYNAKSGGQYTGIKEKAVYFYQGQITQIVDATRESCAAAAYKPYPELEKLCREIKCPT
jgi:hypothetical protein